MTTQIRSGYYCAQSHAQERRNYSLAGTVETIDGKELELAIVAEQTDIKKEGSRLVEAVVDAAIAYLQYGRQRDIPTLLHEAMHYANRFAFERLQTLGYCSLAAAIVTLEPRLYIANVGTNIISIAREQKLTQISMAHTLRNLRPLHKQLARSDANLSDPEKVVLKIGEKKKVPIDMGLHYPGSTARSYDDYAAAQRRGFAGLLLRTGDAVILSTGHLVAESGQEGENQIECREINQALSHQIGVRAAERVASIALNQQKTCPVGPAVALIQTPFKVEPLLSRPMATSRSIFSRIRG